MPKSLKSAKMMAPLKEKYFTFAYGLLTTRVCNQEVIFNSKRYKFLRDALKFYIWCWSMYALVAGINHNAWFLS